MLLSNIAEYLRFIQFTQVFSKFWGKLLKSKNERNFVDSFFVGKSLQQVNHQKYFYLVKVNRHRLFLHPRKKTRMFFRIAIRICKTILH